MARPKKKQNDEFGDTIKKMLSVVPESSSVSELKIVEQTFPPSNIPFLTFVNVDDSRKIDKFTEKGRRVIVAKYPTSNKIYFMEYIDIGQKHFPRGGIKVFNVTHDQIQYYYYESVVLHDSCEIHKVTNIE